MLAYLHTTLQDHDVNQLHQLCFAWKQHEYAGPSAEPAWTSMESMLDYAGFLAF